MLNKKQVESRSILEDQIYLVTRQIGQLIVQSNALDKYIDELSERRECLEDALYTLKFKMEK